MLEFPVTVPTQRLGNRYRQDCSQFSSVSKPILKKTWMLVARCCKIKLTQLAKVTALFISIAFPARRFNSNFKRPKNSNFLLEWL